MKVTTSLKLYEVRWMLETNLPTAETVAPPLSWSVVEAYEPVELDLASAFACIAMLESGDINISSLGLHSVMALSSGDSLYIATSLLSDPAYKSESKITRVRGNIGRAGIAMLISPEEPRKRGYTHGHWQNVNHDEFDGIVNQFF